MSWRIEIMHRSGYRYEKDVWASYNEVRMTPATTDRQRVISSRFSVSPTATTTWYVDYWGTLVQVFDLHLRHDELEIVSASLVQTSTPDQVSVDCSWEDLGGDDLLDHFDEYLQHTQFTAIDDAVVTVADELRAGAGSPAEAVQAVAEWVRTNMLYSTGATAVTTTAPEALAQRSGVCQDFAHVSIAMLRAMGVPARYVSGYLHPTPDGELGQRVAGQSHAWVEAWCNGWRAFDPTNASPVGERHVLVGNGRDYADVPPFKGVYQGGASETTGVEVTLTRVA